LFWSIEEFSRRRFPLRSLAATALHWPGTGNAACPQIGGRIGARDARRGRRGGQIGGFPWHHHRAGWLDRLELAPAKRRAEWLKRSKGLCTLHPYLSTVILSGLGVQGVKSLAFLRVFLCTLKPDKLQETQHLKSGLILRKPFISGLFRPFTGFSGLWPKGDNIAVALQTG